jgi:DNA-binding transcriptional regulator YiaG
MTTKIEPSEAETRILQAMNELQERLKIERTKSAALVELRAFVEKRPLLTRDVLWGFVKSLPSSTAKRGKKAVKSKHGMSRHNQAKPENAKVAAAIEKAREDKGLSRSALAEKLGVNVANVHWWEKAKGNPSAEFRPKIERVLGIKLPERPKANGHAAP